MENSEKEKQDIPEETPGNGSSENLSGEEILNKIEEDAKPNIEKPADSHPEAGNDLLKKLGLSKKDKHKKETADLQKKADELNDKYLRLYAEFENFKKRNLKERIEFAKMAGLDVISSLLPVLDDFDRAMKQLETSEANEVSKEGIKLIYQKLFSRLETKGLKRMTSISEPFNPELHDAITEIPATDENQKGKVVDEIECGYYLYDKIIRHAKVVVGK